MTDVRPYLKLASTPSVVDTRTKNGWTATIYYDQGCENPRDDDSHFLFLGLKHRRYEIGDETIDHNMDCPNGCDGGFLYNEATDATDIVCDLCSGEGRAISLDMLEAFIQYKYKPLHMRRVGMGDHSRGWWGGGVRSGRLGFRHRRLHALPARAQGSMGRRSDDR